MRRPAERDYYAILGVPETAPDDEIKRVYRRLALQHHPDRNPGDRRAEARFKEISEAYAVLSDGARRREYDGLRAGAGPSGPGAPGDAGRGQPPGWTDDLFRDRFQDSRRAAVFEDLQREWQRMGLRFDQRFLSELLFGRGVIVIGAGGRGGGFRWMGPRPAPRVERAPAGWSPPGGEAGRGAAPGVLTWARDRLRAIAGTGSDTVRRWLGLAEPIGHGGDLTYDLAVTPDDVRRGARYRVTLDRGGRTDELLVTVPAGVRPGTRLRLRGKGEPGRAGRPGDLFLRVRVSG
jgi:curved DNA-binding protein CbpA